ncbi:type II secretion system major pseudopilin GspG [Myxococcus sp. CA051A]|uniref:Type II secretion system core protein G n=1 Tax=Myxococcus llanfairpwllgwyngyllgogerychwyrndrobwllllantysiliogogogochensis TaxID=2590453 RepID=A0A540WZW5_9BACT|nr:MULTISPECIES: type II secretion system major pseudopilin GspG [Myxococcus]NTX04226.1 type II secretion system major pseudopilin GspG [Myxococcus sp. CA040A]NTX13154.1 type II secretion system major pseudopilin GspG [Myxococcus sp. CA056]NTX36395.1 type II secretion system major pseudopilin GspG [Myxococcus sp. CA033]NTX50986.1 type II secretion system major pseudopilin GspG [Myxococcus sp. CA039A]NTX64703.1 type II secretion system major pseudopilin GspG [Myxococcus sp. CA051A]
MSQNTHSQQRRRRNRRGMTLIEIMVVITILGLIAAAVGVAVIPQLEAARRDRASLDIKSIQGALKLYYTKKGKYPDTSSGLNALVETQSLEQMPKDPWNNDYVYLNEGGKPVIISYGADGTAGGEGNDADISSADGASAKNK